MERVSVIASVAETAGSTRKHKTRAAAPAGDRIQSSSERRLFGWTLTLLQFTDNQIQLVERLKGDNKASLFT